MFSKSGFDLVLAGVFPRVDEFVVWKNFLSRPVPRAIREKKIKSSQSLPARCFALRIKILLTYCFGIRLF